MIVARIVGMAVGLINLGIPKDAGKTYLSKAPWNLFGSMINTEPNNPSP